jgi:16S rRNA processing protein RimM
VLTLDGWDAAITVGRIVRPHGIRGHVVIVSETDFVETRFEPGAAVFMQRAGQIVELRVAASRVHDGRPVVSFVGVETMNDAELLRHVELRVARETRPDLPDGSYWVYELEGCRVSTVAGAAVGHVVRVEFSGAAPLLVIAGEGVRGEVLVPLASHICRRVDVVAREIEIDPPAGLLEVNAPGATRPRVKPREAPSEARRGPD